MATWFVAGTSGLDTNAGTSWAAPFQSIAKALSVAASGDVIAVDAAGNYAPSAAITWTVPAGAFSIISATNPGTGTTVTPSPGATESIGGNGAFTITTATGGSALYGYGMTLETSTGGYSAIVEASNGTSAAYFWDDCTFVERGASTTSTWTFGYGASTVARKLLMSFRNCTFSCTGSRAGDLIQFQSGSFTLINPTFSATGATKPVAMIGFASAACFGDVTIRDGDVSGFSTASGYVDLANNAGFDVCFQNLKLSATPALTSGSWPGYGGSVTMRNCDSGANLYTFEFANPFGTLSANTSVSRSSGAQFNGASVSWEIQTTAKCSPQTPFYAPPIALWGTTTTAETPTVEFTFDATAPNPTAALTDVQIWLETDYIAGATATQGTNASGRNASPILAAGTAWTTSTATWSGTSGFTTPTKQKLNPAGNGGTITPGAAGLINTVLAVAVASATLYVDPQVNGLT